MNQLLVPKSEDHLVSGKNLMSNNGNTHKFKGLEMKAAYDKDEDHKGDMDKFVSFLIFSNQMDTELV